ncbi:hypothetical protein A3860_29765 [Niastella vici]|uniref:Fibronectin type-III domain-containing protein n=1 Tax=Niastella vici TaxID=1703345 RepID=A0A1V9FV03_9BACT|nr:cadherin-like beta sandwich domain-containing protein [Niastella vici]OQP62138.1 hypothetical protein A3860_29765 [Niastella vici]
MRKFYLLLGMLFMACPEIFSQVSLTALNTTYSQDFNTLSNSAASSTVPSGWLFSESGTAANTTYNINTGSTATGDTYSFGSSGSTDRAFGGILSGSLVPTIGAAFTNNTGSTVTTLTVSYTGEQWRLGTTGRTDRLDFQYSLDATSLATSTFTWVDVNSLDFNAPNSSGTLALDGNVAANRTAISFTITGLSIPNGATFYFRWNDFNAASSDDGLAIDDFSLTPANPDATLSALAISAGSLTPTFSSSTTSYTASVANGISSITVTPTATNASAAITVNSTSVVSGNASAPISLAVGSNIITTVVTAPDGISSQTYTITVTRAASVPTVILNSGLTGFGNTCINTTAGPNSFTIDGADLDGTDITIAALPGFTYSETSGGTYTSTLTFSYSGTSFSGKIIYVKFSPTAVQSYDGNIAVSGGGITTLNVPATGSGVNATATVSTGTSSAITSTTATVAGTITDAGCSTITSYGIEYSTTPGFTNGTGTQVTASNLSGGNFSAALTGLAPNQTYYYKAFVTTAGGTGYGSQQSFTNTPVPVPMGSQPGMSYTQDFSDIASWTNFVTGTGANHFGGLTAGGTGTIPTPGYITTTTTSFITGTSGGVQKGTQAIVLLSTGASDNTTSAAIDFYMDFTGVNAGTLSFDWASVNNTSGDRNGSLRVYASVDGTTFTELTNVLNFTNFSPTSGTKSNIALPAIFNNSTTARLRFYYYNGTGGASGSRPKLSIDNLTVTAVSTTPCATPTAAPTALIFGTITDVSIQASFTAASPAADNYLVIASTNSSLTSDPVDGQIYNVGDNVGDGTVIANSSSTTFTASGLNASTTYYFFIYSLNNLCTGGPLYYTGTVLTDQATTNAGLPPCTAPATQPTNLVFGTATTSTIPGSFTATTADEYLVLVSTSASLSSNPVNGTAYAAGDVIGNATVVTRGTTTSFTASNLSPNTTYYFYVFSLQLQNCLNGPAYNTASPLSGSQNTQPLPPCTTPAVQPTSLTFNASNTSISGAFTSASGADGYLVIRSTSSTLSATPVDNTDYNVGDNLGGGIVVANTATTSFLATGLTPVTTYYFFVFATNKSCTGGTKYLVTSPLTGSQATTNTPVYNYYFGTLHAHSDYSDGNKDSVGYRPAEDYNYAMNSQCMDFLGISEHNHYSTFNNPGDSLPNYHKGSFQADSFSAANSNFLALYGMEWGVINNGGHVIIYGDGMNDLFGWESGSGVWGSSNNYDIYVGKYDYTGTSGLFKTINDYVAKNTFATLAHPNSTDYNNIANIAYDAVADNAITGSAVESGRATSTNTTYSNPAASMSYLSYFQKMLALGYHLGPTVDHDSHYTNFGRATYSRTGVLAPSLTKTEIIKAFRNMHFYATQDCDTKVDFTINTQIMGSVFTDRNAPVISVNLTDNTTSVSSAVINVMYGVPGSGVTAQKIASATGSSMSYTDNNLANLSTGYYYIDITNGSARIITSPIWYTRNDATTPLPVTLVSFTGQKVNTSIKLSWTTAQESNSREFIVERSTDGRTYTAIGKVAAAGNSDHATTYGFTDAQPAYGVNYYRLKQVDIDGKATYSNIVIIRTDNEGGFVAGPNPARSTVTVYRQGNTEQARIELMDVNGKLIKQLSMAGTTAYTTINVSGLSKGIYLLKLTTTKGMQTQKIMVE